MPLVTRQANTANLFLQSAAPSDENKGLWLDSDDGALTANFDGTGFDTTIGGWTKIADMSVTSNVLRASSLGAFRWYMVVFRTESFSAAATGGIRLNGDAGANYMRSVDNGGTVTTSTGNTFMNIDGASSTAARAGYFIIYNKSTENKQVMGAATIDNAVFTNFSGTWVESSNDINQIDIVAITGNVNAGAEGQVFARN